MSQVFVPAYMIALGQLLPWILAAVAAGLCWLALWLLGKGGWCAVVGWALTLAIVLQVAGLVL